MATAMHETSRSVDSTPWLVRLYPATWRARYGDEFVELLQSRPPSARDRLDILRGALDARIHPQLGAVLPSRVATRGDHLLAFAAVTVGVLLTTWAGIIAIALPRWGMGSIVDENLIAASYGAGFLGGVIAIVVLYALAYRYVHELGKVSTTGAFLAATAFLMTVGEADALGVPLLVLGTVLLGPGLAKVVGFPVAAGMVMATAFMALAMFGFVASHGQELLWLWLGAVYGPSWVLLGIPLRHGPRQRPAVALSIATWRVRGS